MIVYILFLLLLLPPQDDCGKRLVRLEKENSQIRWELATVKGERDSLQYQLDQANAEIKRLSDASVDNSVKEQSEIIERDKEQNREDYRAEVERKKP